MRVAEEQNRTKEVGNGSLGVGCAEHHANVTIIINYLPQNEKSSVKQDIKGTAVLNTISMIPN